MDRIELRMELPLPGGEDRPDEWRVVLLVADVNAAAGVVNLDAVAPALPAPVRRRLREALQSRLEQAQATAEQLTADKRTWERARVALDSAVTSLPAEPVEPAP